MAPGSRLQELTAKYMQNPRRFFVPLANEYRLAGDLDRAIALCREHLPAQPGHMSGHIVLGRAYFEKGDHDAARDVFRTSVSLDDENLIALRHLGDIARLRADVVEARSWYARVLDADPENGEIERLLRSLDTAAPHAAAATSPDAGSIAGQLSGNGAEGTAGSVIGGAGAHSSALADPTPPGLKAIVGDASGQTFESQLVRASEAGGPSVPRALGTLDLSSLDATGDTAVETPIHPSLDDSLSVGASADDEAGITVMDGGGFGFGDLDELIDPSQAGALPGMLPPLDQADFSTGVATPSGTPVQAPADDLLSRPVFGAMASFASWRTAQERDTPRVVPAVDQPVTAPGPLSVSEADESSLQDAEVDAAGTAPEFVTETMAALYVQQGFTRQALDVYRALLERAPGDVVLTMKVMELQLLVERTPVDTALEADADKALQFGDLRESPSRAFDAGTASDLMPPAPSDPLEEAFGRSWTSAAGDAPVIGDDWFADVVEPDGPAGATETDFGVFGLGDDARYGRGDAGSASVASETSGHVELAFASVFASAAIAAADESAATMLVAMAAQMVGRLPKEPPTLPVPDVLELPSRSAADETAGPSAAPLLSFDRFFSGTGAPPRARVDPPVRPTGLTSRSATDGLPAVPSPSLSPTFGGVPVIAPSQGLSAPTWAGFDQFVPPAAPKSPASPTAPSGSTPRGAFWTPAAVPALPSAPAPADPAPEPGVPEAVRDADPRAGDQAASAAEPTPAEPTPAAPPRTPPSDFHRWLEGLS